MVYTSICTFALYATTVRTTLSGSASAKISAADALDEIEPELLAVLALGFAGPLSASARAEEDLE